MAGVLTTAGLAKYNSAVANGKKIKVQRLAIGANTAAVSPSTTTLGAELFSSSRVSVFTGFSANAVSFKAIVDLPNVGGWRNVGIYDDTNTLIAVERYNIAAAGALRQKLLGLSLEGLANNAVFDNWMSYRNTFASVSDTLRLVRQAHEFASAQVPDAEEGTVYRWSSPVDVAPAPLMRQVSVTESPAELAQAKLTQQIPIFNRNTLQILRYSNGAWVVAAGETLVSAFGDNSLLWSQFNKKAYLVQPTSTLLRVI